MSDEFSPRERIMKAVSDLLARQGYYATGLNQIVEASGAPKGSLYHYFPGGKAEIVAAAIEHKIGEVSKHIERSLAVYDDPAEAIRTHIYMMAFHLLDTFCQHGSPIAAVALETATTDETLREVCRNAYQRIRQLFEDKLVGGGFSREKAFQLSTTIIAAVDGGLILARLQCDAKPLEMIADSMAMLIRAQAPTL